MISEKANDLLNDFGGKQFDFASGFRRGDAGDAARLEARNKLASYIASLESENARLKDAQRWIPVSERLPEGDAVLVYRERGKSNIDIDWTFIEGGREYWYNSGLDNVTHWMPLPEPPEVTE